MFIKRVEVEEGFLHGLDLELGPGLTVVIGARGSGKTSIIELIRFCLAVRPYTEGQGEISRQHAIAVLGSGRVTVTVDVGGEEVILTRSASEQKPRRSMSRTFPEPIVLSQNEIERVGRDPVARLRLIDGFATLLPDNERSEQAARSLISSLTVELRGILEEAAKTQEEIADLSDVQEDLKVARDEAAKASADLEGTKEKRQRLEEIGQLAAAGNVRVKAYERAQNAIQTRLQRVEPLIRELELDAWPEAAKSEDRLQPVRGDVAKAGTAIESAVTELRNALEKVSHLQEDEQQGLVALEDEARKLRTFIEDLSEGAGALMKRVSDLEQQESREKALRELHAQLHQRADDVRNRRESELDRLDELRELRVNSREDAAIFLNERLGPRVRVNVNRFGSVDAYADVLAEALRGSGVQYNVLAPQLAKEVSPREIAAAAEAMNAEALSDIAGITVDRAQRVCAHLHDVGTDAVLTAPLEDTVDLALLDGGEYKSVEQLSVGQRCTAVLPIVLSHTDHVLLVDQPEDNLDNSFIAETLVRAIQNRPSTAQILFATHNPNIPVLGEADRVVYLTSDGRRGEVDHVGPLDHPESVSAITDIMEGGREAFDRRVAFYAQEAMQREST